jgi:hypothetical protein
MTDSERRLLVLKCGKLLQDVLVEIRTLTFEEGHYEQVNDLADLTHNIPMFMVGLDDFAGECLRECFVDYVRKYSPNVLPEDHRYVMLLDMDEMSFKQLYCMEYQHWPEPEAVLV